MYNMKHKLICYQSKNIIIKRQHIKIIFNLHQSVHSKQNDHKLKYTYVYNIYISFRENNLQFYYLL